MTSQPILSVRPVAASVVVMTQGGQRWVSEPMSQARAEDMVRRLDAPETPVMVSVASVRPEDRRRQRQRLARELFWHRIRPILRVHLRETAPLPVVRAINAAIDAIVFAMEQEHVVRH